MQIYLSYAVEDQATARQIADVLTAAGHEVLDSMRYEGIPGGGNWKQATEQAILDCGWFLAVVSPHYASFMIGLQQLLFTLDLQKPVLPVVVQPARVPLLDHLDAADISGDPVNVIPRLSDVLQRRANDMKSTLRLPSFEVITSERQRLLEAPGSERVFIAAAPQQRNVAQELARMLLRHGKAVFHEDSIQAGAPRRQTIQKALDDATHLVVVWTPEAVISNEVEREVSYALAEGKLVVPIVSRDISKLPYHLDGLPYLVLHEDLSLIEGRLLKALNPVFGRRRHLPVMRGPNPVVEKPDTVNKRPVPKRPLTGLQAWKATIGYISAQYSPDAILKIEVYPMDDGELGWAASASWGQEEESVRDMATLMDALQELWQEVDHHHQIFRSDEDAAKAPVNYDEEQWVERRTWEIIDRLVRVTGAVFGRDWRLILIYQPVDNPDKRVQSRLIARGSTVQVSGSGPTMRDACHDLYRNAARFYITRISKPENGDK